MNLGEVKRPPSMFFRRKKDQKRRVTYTLLLVGPSGTGKTTFANNLLESSLFPHRFQDNDSPCYTNPLVKMVAPTKVVTFNSRNGIPAYLPMFEPKAADLEPGMAITATTVEISTDKNSEDARDKICLNLIDTHGMGENLDNTLCFDEIIAYLEQQFDFVLAEESRIKRNPRFEDGRVHIALYFIEPTGHGLRELDVDMMKKLSKYTNVLPIISRADSFTSEELLQFKKNILEDIEYHNIPVYKFEVEEDEDDPDTIEATEALAKLQPFAIISSDVKDSKGRYVRTYPWGHIEVEDENISNLVVLKSVLFGTHLQEFKDITNSILYENYRADKLSSISDWSTTNTSTISQSNGNKQNGDKSSTMSIGLSSLVNTSNSRSKESLTPPHSEIPAPSTPTVEYESHYSKEAESPIRQLSSTIRRDNEEIIRNIKSSPSSGTTAATSNSSEDAYGGRSKLRNISETLPYVLRHERIIAKQQKLQELETQSARELQKKIQMLERKATELKIKERLLKQQSSNGSSLTIDSSVGGATSNASSVFENDQVTTTDKDHYIPEHDNATTKNNNPSVGELSTQSAPVVHPVSRGIISAESDSYATASNYASYSTS